MKLSDRISRWIRQKIQDAGANGAVFGLSGGIDSSVVAALCNKALGDQALALIMPCHSEPSDEQDAYLVAERLGIRVEKIVLDSLWDEFARILPAPHTRLAMANLKPRLRMATLYYFANSLNYLVVGSGNKSELSIGYFTKYGDAGADILPLGGLLKTQVRELARELGVPNRIIEKPPTAGLWNDQTDEAEIGLSYEQLDKAILALESNNTTGLRSEIVAKVRKLMDASRHKRATVPLFLP
ncbi:MAG: NAD+ synthase [Candidatus Latescibacteria bacterium]|nr:NAD+ synthase [Candidatus Latescibacterota bacterium]